MTRTLTAMYDSRDEAENARRELAASGVTDIDIVDQSAGTYADGGESRGFFGALKDMFMPDEDRYAYSEGLRRGHYLLTARVDEDRCDEVIRLLDGTNAVDFDRRQSEWRDSGWDATRYADEERAIPLAEERLRVGKREVDRGSVRVRSYVEETPVHEEVSLREDRVDVERRPVDETVRADDDLFREREIEMSERGEEAVVDKEAVVTEEVRLRPETHERTEHIDETVRRTDVEVDDDRREGLSMQDRDRDLTATDETRTFADDDDRSIAMDSEGERVNETDEERRRRLERERDLRP